MKTSTVVILGLVAALCIAYCTAAPECTGTSTERASELTWSTTPKEAFLTSPSTEREAKTEKPKADKGASGTKKPEDQDESSEETYKSKPGDKADVSTYKNSRIFWKFDFTAISLKSWNSRARS